MVDNYSAYIPVDLAKRLLKFGMSLHKYHKYDDGKPYFDIPGYGELGWEGGDRYRIPTYGEVFDWFATVKYIVITLEPFHTYALQNHIGYTWKVTYPDVKLGGLVVRTEEDEWDSSKAFGGSFGLTANDAIEYAMTITVNPEVFMEVNIEDL